MRAIFGIIVTLEKIFPPYTLSFLFSPSVALHCTACSQFSSSCLSSSVAAEVEMSTVRNHADALKDARGKEGGRDSRREAGATATAAAALQVSERASAKRQNQEGWLKVLFRSCKQ